MIIDADVIPSFFLKGPKSDFGASLFALFCNDLTLNDTFENGRVQTVDASLLIPSVCYQFLCITEWPSPE